MQTHFTSIFFAHVSEITDERMCPSQAICKHSAYKIHIPAIKTVTIQRRKKRKPAATAAAAAATAV